MSKVKRIIAAFAVAVVGLAGAFIAPAAASAAYSDCGGTQLFCIWKGTGATGDRYDFGSSVFPGCVNIGGSFYHDASSWRMVRTGAKVKFYADTNCWTIDGLVSSYYYPVSQGNFGSLDGLGSFYWTYG